jgi:hypothetical protein
MQTPYVTKEIFALSCTTEYGYTTNDAFYEDPARVKVKAIPLQA